MTALVTGASSGIGLQYAVILARDYSCDLLMVSNQEKELEAAAKEISQSYGVKTYPFFCDLARQDAARTVYDYAAKEGLTIDILINNAGVQGADDVNVNLLGTIDITEEYGIHPDIKSVLMIGSACVHTGSEFPVYAASKGGVVTYAKNVALRIAPYGATCNSLDFGGVITELNAPVIDDEELWNQIMDLTPLKRWMSVEETADWAYFMTVTNRFCTGQNILIDGLEAGNATFVWK